MQPLLSRCIYPYYVACLCTDRRCIIALIVATVRFARWILLVESIYETRDAISLGTALIVRQSRFFVIEFLRWFIDGIEVATIDINGGSA